MHFEFATCLHRLDTLCLETGTDWGLTERVYLHGDPLVHPGVLLTGEVVPAPVLASPGVLQHAVLRLLPAPVIGVAAVPVGVLNLLVALRPDKPAFK